MARITYLAISASAYCCVNAGLLPLTCNVHVDARNGVDTRSGAQKSSAFRTLHAARDQVRALPRPLPTGGVTVCVHPGVYAPLVLDDPRDSGDASGRVTWQGLPSVHDPVLISCGTPVTFTPTGAPETAPWQASLFAQGVPDVGSWAPSGFLISGCEEAPLELFSDGAGGPGSAGFGAPFTTARWPNIASSSPDASPEERATAMWDVEASWTRAQYVKGQDTLDSALYLNLSASPLSGWGPPPGPPSTPWFWSGYPFFDWADATVPVDAYNATTGFMSLQPRLMPYNVSFSAKFFVQNAAQALDAAWEYYVDSASGVASLLPPPSQVARALQRARAGAPQSLTAWASVNVTGISVVQQANVTLSSLSVSFARGAGVSVTSSAGVVLLDLVVTGTGSSGISVIESTGSSVLGCNVSHTGGTGVDVYGGGNRSTLTSCGNTVADCRVSMVGRRCMSYAGAIGGSVIGSVIAHNDVSITPHIGMGNTANDALIEYNVIHDTVLAACDMGAVYDGAADWSVWNTTVRYNFFYRNGFSEVGCNMQSGSDVADIYFDEAMAGASAYGNVHWMPVPSVPFSYLAKKRVTYAHILNGGTHTSVRNSIVVDANISATESGDALASDFFPVCCAPNGTHIAGMIAMHWNTGVYAERYPALAALAAACDATPLECAGNPACPAAPYNVSYALSANVNVTTVLEMGRGANGTWPESRVNTTGTWEGGDPGWVVPDPRAALNFQLADDSPLYALGFARIPMECFGPDACVQPEGAGAAYPRAAHHRRTLPVARVQEEQHANI